MNATSFRVMRLQRPFKSHLHRSNVCEPGLVGVLLPVRRGAAHDRRALLQHVVIFLQSRILVVAEPEAPERHECWRCNRRDGSLSVLCFAVQQPYHCLVCTPQHWRTVACVTISSLRTAWRAQPELMSPHWDRRISLPRSTTRVKVLDLTDRLTAAVQVSGTDIPARLDVTCPQHCSGLFLQSMEGTSRFGCLCICRQSYKHASKSADAHTALRLLCILARHAPAATSASVNSSPARNGDLERTASQSASSLRRPSDFSSRSFSSALW